jgi:glycosyltransferase involved in cell wall biosynthesis
VYLRCDTFKSFLSGFFLGKFDVVLVDSIYFLPSIILARWHSLWYSTRVIISTHGGLNIFKGERKKLLYTYLLSFWRYPTFAVAGKSELNRANKLGLKCQLVRNGVEFKEDVAERTAERNEIVYLGRNDVFGKGFDRMFEFLRENLSLTINAYGKGLDVVVPKDLQNRFLCNDPVFGAEKAKVIKESSGLILLSRREGLPMSCIESLSLGRPVIVSTECNLDDIYGVTIYNGGEIQWELVDTDKIKLEARKYYEIEVIVESYINIWS